MLFSPVWAPMSQTHERGIICDFITESPEDYETNQPAEPFASPYDPALPRATRATAAHSRPVRPIQRPDSGRFPPESKASGLRQVYLAKQFAAYRPPVEQVGLIGAPSGLSSTGFGYQGAYNHHQHSPVYLSTSSRLYPSTITCDRHSPYAVYPNSDGSKASYVPTIGQSSKGVYAPTWDQLDIAPRQIKDTYPFRSLLDPHGHRLRTHAPVLPNIPSKDRRIWSGLVPLASGNSVFGAVGGGGCDMLDDLARDFSSVESCETWNPESPVSPLWLDEPWTPTSVTPPGEPLVSSPIGYQFNDSDEESAEHSDWDEAPFGEVIEAWDKLDNIVIQVRSRSKAFVYPSKLNFLPANGSDNKPLLNERSLQNKTFIRYWEFLYHSLDELNGMEPLSESMVVAHGRAFEEINSELEELEAFSTALWEKKRQAMERRRFWYSVFASGYEDDE